MGAHHESSSTAPAILAEVNPTALPRAILVENNRSYSWITEKICGIIEGKTPTWWWVCFALACFVYGSGDPCRGQSHGAPACDLGGKQPQLLVDH